MKRACMFFLAVMVAVCFCVTGTANGNGCDGGGIRSRTREILAAAEVNGGLIVHVRCGDGKLTAALRADDGYVVHGLDQDAKNVARAREHIRSKGLYGPVSTAIWDGETLPYASSVVNLVVAEEDAAVEMSDVMRVLAPRGVAYIKKNGKWRRRVKPWPPEIDEWTHYMHGPDGNKVAEDSGVAPPKHIKWRAKPLWNRQHRHGNMTAMVSSGGRLFHVSDDVEPCIERLPERLFLVARNAFNGVLLWKRPVFPNQMKGRIRVPYDAADFILHEPPFPMEPKVVAHGDRLYLAFGRNGEIQKLNGANGELLKVYDGTQNTDEVLFYRGKLLSVAASEKIDKWSDSPLKLNSLTRARRRGDIIRVVNAEHGGKAWEYKARGKEGLVVSPVVKGDRVFLVDHKDIVALDFDNGKQLWNTALPPEMAERKGYLRSFLYTKGPSVYDRLIATKDVLLLVNGQRPSRTTYVHAFSVEDGSPLWNHKGRSPARAGSAAYVVDNRVWVDKSPLVALDLVTGRQKAKVDTGKVYDVGHHHRCYGNRATTRFLLAGRRGVEFIGFDSDNVYLHHWIRGKCRFGILPCNGLLYTLPHACSCYPYSTLPGYSALSGRQTKNNELKAVCDRLEEGPAYGTTSADEVEGNPSDWPTLRHDIERSGSTPCPVAPEALGTVWETTLGGKPTSLTAAGGRIFVAVADEHRVYALDNVNGEVLWGGTAGGPVDSPPTLYNGLVLFGSADGYVYCLRADNGGLVWRFLAAQRDRRIVAHEQLESVWPVHGAVLAMNGLAYFSAGRTSLLDGGIALYAVKPETGKVVSENVLYHPYSEAEKHMVGNHGAYYDDKIGVLQDVLLGDGKRIYLKQLQLNPENLTPQGYSNKLISEDGLLNPTWNSRAGWYFGIPKLNPLLGHEPLETITRNMGGPFGNPKIIRRSNAPRDKWDLKEASGQGQYLVYDDKQTYSVRLFPRLSKFTHYFVPGEKGYPLFADNNQTAKNEWYRRVPLRVEAMVATGGETLFLGGTPDIVDPEDPWGAIDGRKGGLLWAISARNGEKITEMKLDSPPVFDGMIAAGGKLFLSQRDGRVVCFKSSRASPSDHRELTGFSR